MSIPSTVILLSCAVVAMFLAVALLGRRCLATPVAIARTVPVTSRRLRLDRGSRTVVLHLRIELEVEEDGSARFPGAIRARGPVLPSRRLGPVAAAAAAPAPPTPRRALRFRAFVARLRRLVPAILARSTAKIPGLFLRFAVGLW